MDPLNIMIVGYGRMGHAVEEVAKERGHNIIYKIDPYSPDADFNTLSLCASWTNIDVAIEFSRKEVVEDNAHHYTEHFTPAVVGTTKCESSIEDIEVRIRREKPKKSSYLYSRNFAVAVWIMNELVKRGILLFNDLPQYDILGFEIHHMFKVDSPSGTAKMLSNTIKFTSNRKDTVVFDKLDRPLKSNEFQFSSLRGGYNPGEHSVIFDSKGDTIEIKHSTRSRRVFAEGAVMAAEWLKVNKKKGFFTMNDFMEDMIKIKGDETVKK